MRILEVENLKKVYTTRLGAQKVEALTNVSFCVEEGEFVAIMGESGSGKTTLLNILAALDSPTAGAVYLDGRNLSKIGQGAMAAFRRDNLGFVFQEFNLLDTFTVEDNIYLPLVLASRPYWEMRDRLTPLAEKLGIGDGQTVLMVTHSVKAASHAGRVLFIKDGQVFHQLYRGGCTDQEFYQRITDALTALATGREEQ